MFLEEMKLLTDYHFQHPQAGDRFQEMYSFWVHVVLVTTEQVIVEEYCPPCSVPKDAKLRVFESHDAFREAYGYTSKHGAWVYYCDNKAPIDHWKPQGDGPCN
jgi:hypothetical protein